MKNIIILFLLFISTFTYAQHSMFISAGIDLLQKEVLYTGYNIGGGYEYTYHKSFISFDINIRGGQKHQDQVNYFYHSDVALLYGAHINNFIDVAIGPHLINGQDLPSTLGIKIKVNNNIYVDKYNSIRLNTSFTPTLSTAVLFMINLTIVHRL